MIRKYRLAIIAAFLAVSLTGCDGPNAEAPIEKSPYAPTQAQLDEMTKAAMPHSSRSHAKKAQ